MLSLRRLTQRNSQRGWTAIPGGVGVRIVVQHRWTTESTGFATFCTVPATSSKRPSLVLVYRDPHYPFIDPFEPDFAKWYGLRAHFPTPLGFLEVFRRIDEPH